MGLNVLESHVYGAVGGGGGGVSGSMSLDIN